MAAKRKAPNKGKRYPAETLTAEEIERLLDAIEGRSTLALRNRALIATMYRGGLRASEAVALRPSDVEPRGELHVREGKGGKGRRVGLDDGCLALLDAWLERRDAEGFANRQPLFCTSKGTELATAYLRQLLPRLARSAGLDKRVHPHILRHSRAAELARDGVPVNVVQAALGHSSLATTSTYLAHVAPTDVIDAMQGTSQGNGKRRNRRR